MKILMIAPEPFFEPRGTPFSEYFRIKALSALGHQVDLITYPIGEDKRIPGLRIFRGPKIPFIRRVKTGPSFAKLILDGVLFFRVAGRLLAADYDLIHTHEEASVMGVFFSKTSRIPHLYDMHASLVQHMDNFEFTRSRVIVGIFRLFEKWSLRNARSVIVICRALAEYAAQITAAKKLTVIENFMDETPARPERNRVARLRLEINPENKKLVVYAGTLEAYQGIPLLLDSWSFLDDRFRLVLVGGNDRQIAALEKNVAERGLSGRVRLLGRRQSEEIPPLLLAADVLVSPRSLGTNIPLKIYSYLRSGVPVVATNLYTHTQSLSNDIAILAEPNPPAFAAGIRRAAGPAGQASGRRAREYCHRHYTAKRYIELVRQAVAMAVGDG